MGFLSHSLTTRLIAARTLQDGNSELYFCTKSSLSQAFTLRVFDVGGGDWEGCSQIITVNSAHKRRRRWVRNAGSAFGNDGHLPP